MAPLTDKFQSLDKFHSSDNSDVKPNRFSLCWFLKRSKSSKSAKEMVQAERCKPPPVSKSCDSGMSGFTAMDKCSTFLLWKLMPLSGKTTLGMDKCKKINSSRSFKTSFSCNDVSRMTPSARFNIHPTKSSHNVITSSELQNEQLKNSSHNDHVHKLQKRHSSLDCLSPSKLDDNTVKDYPRTVCQLVLCKLCLTMMPVQNMHFLHDCGCSFCVMCMKQYLFVNIKEGNIEIMCPDADCILKGKILVPEIQILVGEEFFFKFQKFKLNNDVELDPCRAWCPTPGCETICCFSPSLSNSEIGVSVHCLNCKSTFCSSCKLRWHADKTCDEMKLIMQEDEDLNFSDDEDAIIKRCPSCRVPIERDEGCAQMMCKKCKHVFCWHCLASLDDDFLLRHYDKGPCRNKLGHSRASMVWHRTQVVGIFVGFSFLLLVASPVLLLAAPCLLCCRCKNCKFFYEEATSL